MSYTLRSGVVSDPVMSRGGHADAGEAVWLGA